ncbi:MAG TPA: CDP-alcohol phosphatidyltransferase family protein [Candidatus Binatia bacterium]|nr:CDP-alcohol phosphatidyltransferase family protein [Candidatus Binatia bacterium]
MTLAARRRFPRHAGDLLTAGRVVLTPVFALLVWHAPRAVAAGWAAGLLFPLIAASDFLDGRVARRAGVPSAVGRVLDHGADITFIVVTLSTYAALDVIPWWVPAAVAISFATYVFDSWRHRAGTQVRLIPSRIGHLGGVCNWVLIGVLVYNTSVAIDLLPRVVLEACFAAVPLYSGAAIAERRLGWRTSKAVDIAS